MNYKGSKFKGLRDKERKVNYSKDKKTDEEKLLEEFEKMLNDQEDFGTYDSDFVYPVFPDFEDLEYPEYPPVIEDDEDDDDKCKHKKTKKVFYTDMKAYIMCVDCKADLGDAEWSF